MAEAKPKTTAKVAQKPATKIDPLLKQLLEAGAHFGHRTARWNPKMSKYIYGERSGVHIIDLQKTADGLKAAEAAVEEATKLGGQILFVSTKRQAQDIVRQAAESAKMPYVTYRWLGGMLTNLETIKARIARMKKLETQEAEGSFETAIKKEKLRLTEEMAKLQKIFNGVRDMYGVPAMIFVIDVPREGTAIAEAVKLNIPVIALTDTNADPDGISYVIPGNDDALKSVAVITERIASAALKGSSQYITKAAEVEPIEADQDVTPTKGAIV
jgi:small subunit ribosomal protein S2